MTEEMLRVVLETAQAKTDKEGWASLPDGRTMTLYAAHEGVSLTVAKVEKIRILQGIVRAQNAKGETFLLAAGDLFAAAIDGQVTTAGRRPGFV